MKSTNLLQSSNAHVCSILPSVAPRSLTKVDYIDTILDFLDKQMKANAHDSVFVDRLHRIKTQLEKFTPETLPREKKVIRVDPDKTVLLAYTFGSIYSEALALVTGNDIHMEVFDDSRKLTTSELKSISDSYWDNRGKVAVFVRVSIRPLMIGDQPIDTNVYLQIRRMIGEIGLTLNLENFDVVRGDGEIVESGEIESHEPWVQNKETVTVNVYNWYCSCKQFAQQLIRPHNSTGGDILNHISCPTMANWFSHSGCNHISPLPVCMHLLAVVMGVYNRREIEIPVRQIEVTEI